MQCCRLALTALALLLPSLSPADTVPTRKLFGTDKPTLKTTFTPQPGSRHAGIYYDRALSGDKPKGTVIRKMMPPLDIPLCPGRSMTILPEALLSLLHGAGLLCDAGGLRL